MRTPVRHAGDPMSARDNLTRYICLFHDTSRGHAAVQALAEAGFPPSSVSTLERNDIASDADFADRLSALGAPDRDVTHLRDGVARGGIVISLEASEDQDEVIEKIFHHYTADKIDEADLQPSAPYAATLTADVSAASQAVIPIVEESLVVGKREVDRGGVRVFARTVAQPVSESVSLHQERVSVERHAVDRRLTEADFPAGAQEIELTSTDEVPVVQKVSRVVEEVRVGKIDTEHTETVQDSVRHTEVDVEPLEGGSTRDRL